MKRMPRLSTAARRQLARGTRVELEHTRSRRLARLIAAHHLSESPRYYVELAKMEKKLMKNPIEEIEPALARVYIEEARAVWLETKGETNADWLLLASADIENTYGVMYKLYIMQQKTEEDDPLVQWILRSVSAPIAPAGATVGGGIFVIDSNADKIYAREKSAAIFSNHRKAGLYTQIIKAVRRALGFPIYSDFMRSRGCDQAWRRLKEKGEPVEFKGTTWKYNPAPHVPVMSYGAAHRWEAMAKAKGVSAVARSPRGFMRAYERAGTWARLDPWWKNRRNAFVARHMAQVRQNGEKLWKPDKSGNLQPSRRCLALLMWAFMPRKS